MLGSADRREDRTGRIGPADALVAPFMACHLVR